MEEYDGDQDVSFEDIAQSTLKEIEEGEEEMSGGKQNRRYIFSFDLFFT
jgi:hypothetical protein